MTTLNFVGGATPDVTTSWTGNSKVFSNTPANGVALPTTGRTDSNGNKPIYVSTAQVYWAGRGGSRSLRIGIGSAYSSYYTVAADSSANASGQKTIGGIFLNGGNQTVTIDESGSSGFYFGRQTGTTGSMDNISTWGRLSGSLVYYQVPNAPTAVTVAQAALENAVNVSWTAPSDNGGTAVKSYAIVWSYNSDFSGSNTINTGTTATTRKITGLTYGSTVYVKVAAINDVATAAGSTSVFSSSASGFIVPPNMSLDGWGTFGTVTNNTRTVERTVIPALTPKTGMLLTGTSTATGGTYSTGAVGIQKTYTNLVIGRQYTMAGKAILRQAAVPANIYRFGVSGIGNGSTVTLSSTTTGSTIPSYTFTATSTTHVLQIQLGETFTVTSVGVQESVGFYDFTLTKIATDLTYRLQDNQMTGSLVEHFDLATRSVGANWWVDKNNVTQFAQDFDYSVPLGDFSDVVADGNLYYNTIETSFDTEAIINEVKFDNLGVKKNGFGTAEIEATTVEWVDTNSTSTTNWGARSYSLETNLRTEVVAENLFPFPSFEEYTNRFEDTNFFYSAEQPGLDSAGAWTSFDGSYAYRAYCKATAVATVALPLSEVVPVTAGTTYYGFAYAAASAGANSRSRFFIQWQNDAQATISTTYGSYVNHTSLKTWYKTAGSAAAPAGAVWARIGLQFSRTTGANIGALSKYWTDGMYFGTANESTWFDGNTTDSASYVYSWNGSNNESPSTKYTNIMDTRTAELLAAFADPIVRVKSLRWNTAQNPIVATNTDIGSLFTVTFQGTTATYRVVGINHDITPERWMMDLSLAKVV